MVQMKHASMFIDDVLSLTIFRKRRADWPIGMTKAAPLSPGQTGCTSMQVRARSETCTDLHPVWPPTCTRTCIDLYPVWPGPWISLAFLWATLCLMWYAEPIEKELLDRCVTTEEKCTAECRTPLPHTPLYLSYSLPIFYREMYECFS